MSGLYAKPLANHLGGGFKGSIVFLVDHPLAPAQGLWQN